MKIIYCLIRTVNNFTWTFTVLWFCGSSSSVWSFELLLTLVLLGKPAGTQFKSHTVFLSISVHHGWRSGVRGSTGGHKPKRCGQRGEPRWAEPRRWWPPRGWAEGSPAPPAHTPYMCYISYSHKEHLTPFLPYRLFFFLNNQSPLSLFSVPHLWLSENLRNLSFFTRFTNSFLIYFKLSKWLAQDLNN